MFAGGLVLGSTLIFFAFWLQWTETRGWPHDGFDGDDDGEYLANRRRLRSVVNLLIAVCGVLILTAAWVGAGLTFIAAWSTVTLILFLIVVLAGYDALRTHRYHRGKLRRLRENAFKD